MSRSWSFTQVTLAQPAWGNKWMDNIIETKADEEIFRASKDGVSWRVCWGKSVGANLFSCVLVCMCLRAVLQPCFASLCSTKNRRHSNQHKSRFFPNIWERSWVGYFSHKIFDVRNVFSCFFNDHQPPPTSTLINTSTHYNGQYINNLAS